MENFELKKMSHYPGLIEFSWNDIGGIYHVFRNRKLIYKGTDSECKDNDLNSKGNYVYSIEQVQNGEVLNVITLQTASYSIGENLENPLQALVFSTIVTKEKIVLSWEYIRQVEEYSIYRDDDFLAIVKTNQYSDYNFSLNKSYVYKILFKRPLVQTREVLGRGKSVVASIIESVSPNSNKEKVSWEEFRVIKLIGKANNLLIPTKEKKAKENIDDWKFRYTTFLKEKWTTNLNVLSVDHYFKGDDRDFDVRGASFRTRVNIRLNFKDEKKRLVYTKEVGETLSYNRAKKFRQKATASNKDIKLIKLDYKEQEVGFLLTHSVGNPIVSSAPGIDYKVQSRINRDGSFDITGFHDQAPHHEIYLSRGSDGDWIPIHLAESKGLVCMSEVIASRYWRYSNFE